QRLARWPKWTPASTNSFTSGSDIDSSSLGAHRLSPAAEGEALLRACQRHGVRRWARMRKSVGVNGFYRRGPCAEEKRAMVAVDPVSVNWPLLRACSWSAATWRRLSRKSKARTVLSLQNWGEMGHAGTVPELGESAPQVAIWPDVKLGQVAPNSVR